MTQTAPTRHSGPSRTVRRGLTVAPRLITRLRRRPPRESVALVVLALVSIAATVGAAFGATSALPPVFLSLPLLFGGLLLGRAALQQLMVVVVGCLVYDVVQLGLMTTRPGSLVVVFVTGLVAYEFARSREETGLGGLSGDSVLVELGLRLKLQGELPRLPSPWRAESVVKPAGGGFFAGDFVVSALTGAHRFEVALVDVSGKGVDAGTRALLLSGALGGLLGAKAPEDYLEAANSYLVRQDWDEGFATAVHMTLDFGTGAYQVTSAGHPPAAHFDAGSGRWGLLELHGPALGLIPDAAYEAVEGTLRPGDALLLYTDGLVEVPGRDLSVGIDKLLGEAERLVPRGFDGGGEVLVNRVSDGSSDDRGLVLLWRSRQ